MAGYRDSGIVIPRGDDATLDGVAAISGTPQNITGWSLWFTAKYRLSDLDAAAVIQKTTAGGGVVITNAPVGVFHVDLLPADTVGLPAEEIRLFGDVQGKDAAGHVYTLDRLLFSVGPDTTQGTT